MTKVGKSQNVSNPVIKDIHEVVKYAKLKNVQSVENVIQIKKIQI
jgi:hypothetical protein